jgi:hypothetical protein
MRIKKKKQKAMNFRLILISTLIFTSPLLLNGQSYSEKRVFQKSFVAKKGTTVEITNKYGTIHLSTWNKDSVSMRAELEAFASSQSKVGKMFEGININFSEANQSIIATTDFVQSINMLFESFKGMTNKLIPYDSRIQINYFVSLPDYANIKIDNKYGDVYMEDNNADLSVSLSNGSFKANNINSASKLKFTFCDATINKMGAGTVDASFSEIVITESKNLSISSISSRFDLKHAGKINVESRRDKFFIGSIESAEGDSYFTDFKIELLKDEINLVPRYGSLYVYLIETSFKGVTLNTGYTDVSLTFAPEASYNLDIRHINAYLSVPEKNSKLEKKSISEDKKEYVTFGSVGINPGKAKVKIDSNRGNIYLK